MVGARRQVARPRARAGSGQLLVLALLVGTPAATFVSLRAVPRLDLLFQSVVFHLIVVSTIAACALGVALLAAVAAGRARRFPLVMLALACLSVGFAMLAHGLTTPGIWDRPFNWWVARYPTLALAGFAAFTAAALGRGEGPIATLVERHALAVVLLFGGLSALAIAPTVLAPTAGIGSHLLPGEDAGLKVIAAISAVVLIVAGVIHRRRWLLSQDRMELGLVVACWLSTEAIASLQFGRLWRLSWWNYHVLLLVGFSATVYAVMAGYRRSRTAQGAFSSVVLRNTLDQIEHGYPDALRPLVTAVEARDAHTRGHSTRVAKLSVRIGEHLGLRPDGLRALAQGGLLHDIGKIGVPDQILNKPGLLTPEERLEIEKHAAVGWDIVQQAPSLRGALAIVRHHHERIDGMGYPDGLSGSEIPLEARIAAVADVWDALTSDRSYRPAWSTGRAMEMMVGRRGTHFDPDALNALLELLDADGIRFTGGLAPVDQADVEACHPTPPRTGRLRIAATSHNPPSPR
jgi:HD-GYP domain-containing protein (c-di-GMP phosphodiesterase class II)